MNNLKHIKELLLDLFFPKLCLGCGKEGVFLCEDCRHILEISECNYCLCDNNPLRLQTDNCQGKCFRCQNKKLSGLYFAVSYKNPLAKKLIRRFKYAPYAKELSKTLAGVLIEHFVIAKKNTDEIWNNGVLVPIPLDSKKIRSRGYNQSEELAKKLSEVLKIPNIPDVLIKTRRTEPQMELNKKNRENNLRGAFSINKNGGMSDVPPFFGKKVFLVDDIYTTGATMEECAGVLLKSGAKSVWGITIAREE